MKKAVLLSIFFTLLLLTINSFAVTYTSIGSGPWTTASNWAPSGVPVANDNIIIQTAITLASGSYSGSGSVTIRNGGSLTVTGDLTMTAFGTKAIVGTNGSLIINGNFTIDNQASLTLSGGSLISGNLAVTGGTFKSSNGSAASVGTLVVNNSGSSVFTNGAGATFSTSGNVTFDGSTTNNGALIVGTSTTPANFTQTNSGGTFTSNGAVTIYGNAIAPGTIQLNPSDSTSAVKTNSVFTVKKNLSISGNSFTVGTNVAPPTYANAVVEGSVLMTGGNATVNRNGRMAIFGDLNLTGGGIGFTIASGGQVYVDGDGAGYDVNVGSGGNSITNNNPYTTYAGNPLTPYGFYVNNTVSPASGGSSVSAKRGDEVLMQNSDPKFYAWISGLNSSPLPVVLAYFRVQEVMGNAISLTWQTTMERNFDRFELERAGEDLQFSTITSIKGKGALNTSTRYAFDDNQPLRGKNYYRLKMIDHDNSTDYSGVIVGNWNSVSKGVSLYPNPSVNHTFTIELDDNYTSLVNVSVIEAKGLVVYASTLETTSSTISLPENLVSGIYFVRISSATEQQTVRLVVD
ncbi:MAG: T9SS type A sorting domain-containing protein [Chryseolinea sp.]